jgi:hypothetical protein
MLPDNYPQQRRSFAGSIADQLKSIPELSSYGQKLVLLFMVARENSVGLQNQQDTLRPRNIVLGMNSGSGHRSIP